MENSFGRPLFAQRTGLIFLVLVVATNFIPWMELLAGETATAEFAVPAEFFVAFGACLLAPVAVFGAWLSGRRTLVPANPRVARPRLLGLRLAILSAMLNLALATVIMAIGVNWPIGPIGEMELFGAVWFLLVLPTQVLAGFCKGRASIPALKPAAASA